MKTKTALQRLSFKIAEEVGELFTDRSMRSDGVTIDDIYLVVWRVMPLDREGLEELEELAEGQEAFDKSISGTATKPSGPSLMQRLREAVHADKGTPLKVVLESAIEKCNRTNVGDIE